MADKRTVCLKLDKVADSDIIAALEKRFNRTDFIRICIRNYLLECKLKEKSSESTYYD